ncbi:MAG: 4-(cytidine 5'-diphospho)-2-C-methyl-D-erythritol kinase [Clostridiales bacterium]|nr:4-(cytidine 5'-diphospho)-2-C-methyl-D-erythritol kinase [Clostridiales bacterium]
MSKTVTVSAPAKINLTLNIGRLREDNYHEVNMIMQAISLCDTITISKNAGKKINIFCDTKGVPLDRGNLVYKAAAAYFKASKAEPEGLDIHIDKNIPVQAGLAGGSTDCAAALLGMNALYDNLLTKDELKDIGGALGADVPFCFDGGTALATGKGTDIVHVSDMPECFIVLIKPDLNVSTKEAYQRADERTVFKENASVPMLKALNNGSYAEVSRLLYNDFSDILNIKEVKEIITLLNSLAADGACMSGSGPSVFGLFGDEASAKAAVTTLKSQYNKVYLCKPVTHGVKIEKTE